MNVAEAIEAAHLDCSALQSQSQPTLSTTDNVVSFTAVRKARDTWGDASVGALYMVERAPKTGCPL